MQNTRKGCLSSKIAKFAIGYSLALASCSFSYKDSISFDYDISQKLSKKAENYKKDTLENHISKEGMLLYKLSVKNNNLKKDYADSPDSTIWTGCYAVSQSLEYAVTKDKDTLKNLEKTLSAIHTLLDITGKKGYVARSFAPIGKKLAKDDESEWHPGKGKYSHLKFRSDTSKCQHAAVIWAYINALTKAGDDLDDKLKKTIKKDLADIADTFMDQDYEIRDIDEKATKHSDFSSTLLGYPIGFNAMHKLLFIKAAHYATRSEKYEKEYKRLIRQGDVELVKSNPRIEILGIDNDSDDNVVFMTLYTLAQIEKDLDYPETALKKSIEEDIDEKNPLFNFIYLANICDKKRKKQLLTDSFETLRQFPSDKKVYFIKDKKKNRYFFEVPFSKRPLDSYFWKADTKEFITGTKTDEVIGKYAGTDFLLAYWLGRYHGFISKDM